MISRAVSDREDGGERRRLRLLACLALVGSALELAGVYWDVGWHHARGRETFWTPPHMAIYAGVALALVAAGLAFVRRGEAGGALRMAILGPVLQVVAAPVDEAWHRIFGKDVSIWSPPHLLGILGGTIAVLGWTLAMSSARAGGRCEGRSRGLSAAFAVFLLAGALFALGEYDHDQASRGPWLYPALASLLGAAVLAVARRAVGRRWAGTAIAVGYTVVRVGLAMAVWGVGLPWMGIPPFVVMAALASDGAAARWGEGAAGALFGVVFTLSDAPLTILLTGEGWGIAAWAGTLAVAAAAGWVGGGLGRWIVNVANRRGARGAGEARAGYAVTPR